MAVIAVVGGTASDTYATLAEYEARATAMGWTLAATDAANEVNLRRAAAYLDGEYAFVGMRQYQTQARAWPRLVNVLVDDWPIDPDTVPQGVKDAQCEMAYLMQGGLDPFATITDSRTRAKVGPIEVETTPTGRPRIVAVSLMLRDYIRHGGGQVAMVRG